MTNFYENFRAACKRHDTTLTEVLIATGHSSGSTGTWKAGRPPRLDVVMEIADYLHVSLDELVYGLDYVNEKKRQEINTGLTQEQIQWLDVLSYIPEEKRPICLDFLKTHMIVPEKNDTEKMA